MDEYESWVQGVITGTIEPPLTEEERDWDRQIAAEDDAWCEEEGCPLTECQCPRWSSHPEDDYDGPDDYYDPSESDVAQARWERSIFGD